MPHEKRRKIIVGTVSWLLAVLFLSPFYIVATNSLKTQKGIFVGITSLPFGEYFSPQNYVEAFERLDFVKSFFNSLMITSVSTVLIIIFASMAAWMLVRTHSKISMAMYFMFAAAMLIPFQSVMLP